MGKYWMELEPEFVGALYNVAFQTETIRKAIEAGDAGTVRRESHSIKGGAANLTADALSTVAYALENMGKSENLEGGMEALEKLEKEFHRLKGYLKKEILHDQTLSSETCTTRRADAASR